VANEQCQSLTASEASDWSAADQPECVRRLLACGVSAYHCQTHHADVGPAGVRLFVVLMSHSQWDGMRSSRLGSGWGQTWSVGMIHSSLMAVWRGRVTM
jgi:hypothetical protein